MFAVYEINTNQIVALFDDRRLAVSHARSLSDDYAVDGYEYAVKKFR